MANQLSLPILTSMAYRHKGWWILDRKWIPKYTYTETVPLCGGGRVGVQYWGVG